MSKLDRNDGTFLTLAAVAALATAGKLGGGPPIARGSKTNEWMETGRSRWNISDEVLKYGTRKGLMAVGTGGGFDYLLKQLPNGNDAIIGMREDAGSPETLDEPGAIMIFSDDEWQQMILIPFQTTRQAIDHLAGVTSTPKKRRTKRGSKSRHRGDLMGYWNIPDEVYEYGTKHGLRGLATGGNIDYMAKALGEEVGQGGSEVWAVLGSYEDAGSPENLDEPANINIFLDESWQRMIILPFKTAREAIEHMGTMLSINV